MNTIHSSKSTQRFETTTVSCTKVATDLVGSETSTINSQKNEKKVQSLLGDVSSSSLEISPPANSMPYIDLPFPFNLLPQSFVPKRFVSFMPILDSKTSFGDLPPGVLKIIASYLKNGLPFKCDLSYAQLPRRLIYDLTFRYSKGPKPHPHRDVWSHEAMQEFHEDVRHGGHVNSDIYADILWKDSPYNCFLRALKFKVFPIRTLSSIMAEHHAMNITDKVVRTSAKTIWYSHFHLYEIMDISACLFCPFPHMSNLFNFGIRTLGFVKALIPFFFTSQSISDLFGHHDVRVRIAAFTITASVFFTSCVAAMTLGAVLMFHVGVDLGAGTLAMPFTRGLLYTMFISKPYESWGYFAIIFYTYLVHRGYLLLEILDFVPNRSTMIRPITDLATNLVASVRGQLSFIRRLIGIETNPGPPTAPAAFIQPIFKDGDFAFWMTKGKTAKRVFKKNEMLFQELAKIVLSDIPEDIFRIGEIVSAIDFGAVVFTVKPVESTSRTPADGLLSDDTSPTVTHMKETTSESTSTIDSVVVDKKPVVQLIDYVKAMANAMLEQNLDDAKVDSLKKALALLSPKHGVVVNHMFSNLMPGIPSVKMEVAANTQDWASGQIDKLIQTLKEFKVGIELPEVSVTNQSLVVALCSVALLAYKPDNLTEISRGIVLIAGVYIAWQFGGTYFHSCYEQLVEVLTYNPACENHINSTLHEAALTALTGLTYYSLYRATPDKKLISEFITSIGNFPKFKNGASDVLEDILKIARDFVNWLSNRFGMGDLIGLPVNNARVIAAARTLNELQTNLRFGQNFTRANADILFAIETELRDVLMNLNPKDKTLSGEIHCVENLIRNIENLATNFVGYANDGMRVPPVTILFVGPSQIGKSVSSHPAVSRIAASIFDDQTYDRYVDKPTDYVYHVQPEIEHDEGYRGQPIWIHDEVLQNKDSTSLPNPEVFNLIRTVNSAPRMMNMANCGAKGNFFANPKIYLGTSNVQGSDIQSIKYKEAYDNRWQKVYVQTPKKEYCVDGTYVEDNFTNVALWNRKLDVNKIPYDAENNVFELDTCDYFPYNFATQQVSSNTPLNFYTAVDDIVNHYERHHGRNAKLHKFHAEYAASLKALRQDGRIRRVVNHAASSKSVSLIKDDDTVEHTTPVINYKSLKQYAQIRAYDYNKLLKLFESEVPYVESVGKSIDVAYWKNYLSPCYEQFQTLWSKTREVFSTKNMLIAASMVLTAGLGFWLFSSATFIKVVPHSGKAKQIIAKRAIPRRSRNIVPKTVEEHVAKITPASLHGGALSQNHVQMVNKFLYSNTYKVFYGTTDKPKNDFAGFLTFMSGTVGVLNKHFWDCWCDKYIANPELILHFELYGSNWSFEISFDHLFQREKRLTVQFLEDAEDILWIKIPDKFGRRHKSIRHFMLSENDPRTKRNFYGSMVKLNDDLKSYGTYMTHVKPIYSKDFNVDDAKMYDSGYHFVKAFKYDVQRFGGECGLSAFYTDAEGEPAYIGIHTAGNEVMGFALPVTRESLDSALKFFDQPLAEPLDLKDSIKLHMAIPSQMEVIREIDPIRIPSTTEIFPGPLHEFLGPPTTSPGHLRPFKNKEGELIDPQGKCLDKYCLPSRFLNEDLLRACVHETYKKFMAPVEGKEDFEPPRLLTMDEAINGYKKLQKLPMSKAVGYSYRDSGKKKRDHFCVKSETLDDDYQVDLSLDSAKKIIAHAEDNISKRNEGISIDPVFINFPKDETRSIEKVEAGKGRQIASEDVVDTLEYRIRLGHMQSTFIEGRVQNGSSVGVNWMSYEAEEVVLTMTKHGNNLDSGDIGNFDGSFSLMAWWACSCFCDLYYYKLSKEERRGMHQFLFNIANAVHVVVSSDGRKAYLVRYVGSMASGFSGTAFFDTILGLIIKRYNVYMSVLQFYGESHVTYDPLLSKLDIPLVENNMVLLQGGDDGLLGVGPYLIDLGLTPKLISDNFHIMGWKYTDENKKEVTDLEFRTIEEISYNSRKFCRNKILNRYVAYLNPVSIEDRIYWKKKKTSLPEYKLNVRSAILEYSICPGDVYSTRGEEIMTLAKDHLVYHDFPLDQKAAIWEAAQLDTVECHMQKSSDSSEEEIIKLPSTTMTDDKCAACVEYPDIGKVDDVDLSTYSIRQFVEKPFFFWESSWTTASAANTILNGAFPINFEANLLANTQMYNKLLGFALMKGTWCIKVMINANPFQAGRLLLHYLPNALQRGPEFVALHNTLLAGKTQQPHVELDCANSSAIMKIPYVAPSNYFRIKGSKSAPADLYDWGSFYITVLAPLRTGASGATSVDLTVYTWLEDLELAAPVVPQGAGGARTKYSTNVVSREAARTGPVSSILAEGASIVSRLGSIPYVGQFAGPTAWGLRVASGVSSVFGYSKPVTEALPMVAARQNSRYSAVSDGVDTSIPLGLIHDQAITLTDSASIRDVDEMSFAYLKTVEGHIDAFTWTTSQVTDTNIYSKNVQPIGMCEGGTISKNSKTVTFYQGPPVFYFAHFNTYVRGSYRIKFKIIKTGVHTGRLQVTWTPNNGLNPTLPTITTGMLAQRWIIDISESNEIMVELPYQSVLNYQTVQSVFGNLTVTVVNQLRCPENVSSTVDVLCWVSGGDDFEFAGPGSANAPSGYPFTPFSPQMMAPKPDSVAISGVIGNATSRRLTSMYNNFSMGESFNSVKQYLNRYCPIGFTVLPTQTNGVSIWPWLANVRYLNASGVLVGGNAGFDAYSAIALCYAYYRGPMRVLLRTNSTDPIIAYQRTFPPANQPSTYNVIDNLTLDVTAANVDGGSTNTNLALSVSDKNVGVVSYTVPYYCRTRMSTTMIQTTDNLVPAAKLDQPTTLLSLAGSAVITSGSGAMLARSTSDDFQFTFFVGCPPVMFSIV